MKNKIFGIRMNGLESPIENIVKDYLNNSKYNEFRFLEIGSAAGATLKAIYEITKENIKHDNWRIDGLDLVNGWSLDLNIIKEFGYPIGIYQNGIRNPELTIYNERAFLWLENNPREWIKNLNDGSIDIAFIDGEHSKQEVTKDFLAVESKIKLGGQIWFHDCGVLETGTDWQPVGQEFINVRGAINDLGLWDNKYPGWEFVREISGSRLVGGDGNSCGVFRKL